jgi:hypothetical protein
MEIRRFRAESAQSALHSDALSNSVRKDESGGWRMSVAIETGYARARSARFEHEERERW